MKHNLRHIFLLIVLLSLLMLSSCLELPALNTDNTPNAASSNSTEDPSSVQIDWHSGVKTDYSGLTPYKPPEEKFTRLKDGAMPSLEPSKQYGELIPYVGKIMYDDWGYYPIRMYGLMTDSGKLVTDPVYAHIYQGYYYDYSTYSSSNVPIYNLEKLSDEIDKNNPWNSIIHAACALDGSWITPFEYSSIFFTDKVIMLVRSNENNDIDIMDFNGNVLYNTRSLGCYSDIPESSAYSFQSGYGEGFIALALSSGRTVYIDVLTGKETYTDYTRCCAFSGGFAAVMQDGLYGYIDKSFNLIVQPQFLTAEYFYNGRSVVQYPDNSYAIIDQAGTVLFKNQYYIGKWDRSTYGVYDEYNNVSYYDNDLVKIMPDNKSFTPLYDGWFFYSTDKGITIFRGDETHTFDDVTGVYSINSGLAVVYKNNAMNSKFQEGLMTLEGKVVIPLADSQSISLVTSKTSGKTFAIASTYVNNQTFKVYDAEGKMLFSGNGYANYNPQYDLFEVNEDISYGYVDTSGNDILRISLMEYVPD